MNQPSSSVSSDACSEMSPALTRQDSQDVVTQNAIVSDAPTKCKKANGSLQSSLLIDSNVTGPYTASTKNGVSNHESLIVRALNSPSPENKYDNNQTAAINTKLTNAREVMTGGTSLITGNKVTTGIQAIPAANTVNELDLQKLDGSDTLTSGSTLSEVPPKQTDCNNLSVDCNNAQVNMNSEAVNVTENVGCIEKNETMASHQLCVYSETEIKARLQSIETRSSTLLKRLRRIQAVEASRHVTQQIALLVENQHGSLERLAKHATQNQPVASTSNESSAGLLHSSDMKSMSTSALVTLVQRMQSTQSSLHIPTNSVSYGTKTSLTINEENKKNLFESTNVMSMNLKHIQKSFDSDATESSSGGETDDEDICCEQSCKPSTVSKPLKQRPCWRWVRDRGAIISRWTWLQAQVSDLEYRIRQHGEEHRKLRANKQTIGGIYESAATGEEGGQRAARCQPFPAPLKRHKLLHLTQASALSAKARRSILVKCQCASGARQCALCAGLHNYALPADMYTCSRNERIAHVDYAYHPVLSFNRDLKPDLELEEMISQCDKKHQVQSESRSMLKKGKLNAKKLKKQKLKKIKKKRDSDMHHDDELESESMKKHKATKRKYTKKALPSKRPRTNSLPNINDSDMNSVPSPLTQSAPASELKDTKTTPYPSSRQKRESAFDIDNIVIPYHMAASTRVEKPQYKEIDTPRWRECSSDGLLANSSSTNLLSSAENPTQQVNTVDTEDISDEQFIARHSKCEFQEKQRYLNFITSYRPRPRSLSTHKSTGSGTATPDPMSPDASFGSLDTALPSPLNNESQNELYVNRRASSSFAANRLRKEQSLDDSMVVTPWEKRQFPLSEADEKDLEFISQPLTNESMASSKWKVVNTDDDKDTERISLVLKLSKA